MHAKTQTMMRERLARVDRVPPPDSPPGGVSRYAAVKAGIDFGLALLLLVATAPLVLVAAVLVKLTSRGPAFYSQARVGRGGCLFRIYKLRTMAHECERRSGPRWSGPGDPRVTAVGWLLRRTHIDELPQLWNVLRGDMSLVGPRPERPEFVPGLARTVPRYRERLAVRPGLTGLAQVQLPPDTDLDCVRRKLAYDLYYVARMGFGLDLRILLSTAFHLLGLPFGLTRLLVWFPGGTAVEEAYHRLGPPSQQPHLTPA